MTYDYKMIDFSNWAGRSFTLDQMMTAIRWMQKTFPDREIFLDGDTYSIMGRRRVKA